MTPAPHPGLVQEVRAALDQGRSLAQLERTLLAGSDAVDEVAAAWLYAWAYDSVRPSRDHLAARVAGDAIRSERGD